MICYLGFVGIDGSLSVFGILDKVRYLFVEVVSFIVLYWYCLFLYDVIIFALSSGIWS